MTWTRLFFSFRGRVARRVWWAWLLFTVLGLCTLVLVLDLEADADPRAEQIAALVVYYALVALPSLAIEVKRLHDTGRSGWWWFVRVIPLIGPIWMLLLLGFLPSTPGNNRFGEPFRLPGREPRGPIVPPRSLQRLGVVLLTVVGLFTAVQILGTLMLAVAIASLMSPG